MHFRRLLLPAVVLALACTTAGEAAKVEASSTNTGDTLTVTISAPESLPALLVTLDSAQVLWTPQELGRPNGMAVGPDGRITVSDRQHLFAMQPGSDTTEVVSREGAGPGEYRSVSGLLAEADGSVLVLDSRQRRMIRLDPHGVPDSTWSTTADPAQLAFLALMHGQPVVATDRGIIHLGEPPDTLYLRNAADSAGPVLGELTLYVWARISNGMLAPRDAYPSLPRLAGSATAGFAFSDGLQYDIRWWRPGTSPAWLHLSRAWTPPPQSIDREPSGDLLAQLPDSGEMVQNVVNSALKGDHKYSLEELALMPEGTLWVRPVDSSYIYDPTYYAQLSELRQPTLLWEVFGSDGKLRAQVRLSSMFTPKTTHDCQLYGFIEDSDGAYSVAAIPLGKECERLAGT